MASNANEVLIDLSPVIKVYKDGRVHRLWPSHHVPASLDDPKTGVSSKDITISQQLLARLYLPKIQDQKLPILLYYHGGGFCIGSAFNKSFHRYMNLLASKANAIVVSVEYRLAPEHPLPAAYQDSWTALQWVASHCDGKIADVEFDRWLIDHGDFAKFFVGGDSAGANIVHNMLMQARNEKLNGDLTILGAILAFPYFWGSNPINSMSSESNKQSLLHRTWEFVYPSAFDGIDNPMINPMKDGAPSLIGLPCGKLFVCHAEKDELRQRGVQYVEAVKKSGWMGEVKVYDFEGEDHCFQVVNPESENTMNLIKLMALFIMK